MNKKRKNCNFAHEKFHLNVNWRPHQPFCPRASKANIKLGQEYIDSVAGANPEVKVAASGLAYQILNPGSEKRANADDLVEVEYTATTTYGDEFDRADAVSARPVPLRLRNEGLQQGIAMLGEGGEAVFYIPGKLAFGTN